MTDKARLVSSLSFDPSSDFELFALEAALDESISRYLEATTSNRQSNQSAIESMLFDICLEEDIDECECDDEDDECEEANEVAEEALKDIGHNFMTWWRAVKTKFIEFCKNIAASLANALRKFQIAMATAKFKKSDLTITVDANVMQRIEAGNFYAKHMANMRSDIFAFLNEVLNTDQEIDEEKILYLFKKYDYSKTNYNDTKIKVSEIQKYAKDASDAIKEANKITTQLDRYVLDTMKANKIDGKRISLIRRVINQYMKQLTSIIRNSFKASMTLVKQGVNATKIDKYNKKQNKEDFITSTMREYEKLNRLANPVVAFAGYKAKEELEG